MTRRYYQVTSKKLQKQMEEGMKHANEMELKMKQLCRKYRATRNSFLVSHGIGDRRFTGFFF